MHVLFCICVRADFVDFDLSKGGLPMRSVSKSVLLVTELGVLCDPVWLT